MKNFNPLIFLKSLGAGGLAVSFFMYLMFMTKHAGPVPTFDTLKVYFVEANTIYMLLIVLSALGILFFLYHHLKVLIKQLLIYKKFRKTEEFKSLKDTNNEVALMSIPLTLAMTMNVFFVVSLIFVPGLWNVIEYIFPIALIFFGLIGFLGLRIYGQYFARIMTKGNFITAENNNLGQMIAAFAFAMIGVGFAGPAAMSETMATSIVAMSLSIFFLTVTAILVLIKLLVGFKEMFKKGINTEGSPSLWIMIPILTLFGISLVRQRHGLSHEFGAEISTISNFIMVTIILSAQLIFGWLGYRVMRMNHYFKDFVKGAKKSIGSYALICPGVAIFVFGMFFIHKGFVLTGIVEKFSIAYFVMLAPIIYIQFITIKTLFRLNKKMK
ncbi:MAG TPA: hypothetical protein VJ892_03870 [Candidatus Absconditabacterales bacterium]|nr:hypothetical protein [Candidatus Absconditabacterales bacterium]